MHCLTLTEKSKAAAKPGLVPSYDIEQGNGVGLFWDTKYIFTYLLTFPGPRPTQGALQCKICCLKTTAISIGITN